MAKLTLSQAGHSGAVAVGEEGHTAGGIGQGGLLQTHQFMRGETTAQPVHVGSRRLENMQLQLGEDTQQLSRVIADVAADIDG